MKPILFNTDMVQAILEGRKTVTRRVVKPQPPATAYIAKVRNDYGWSFWKDDPQKHYMKPPYQPGDILWVRETWSPVNVRPRRYIYKADVDRRIGEGVGLPLCWRPSIHMPLEAARIFLRVTGVRVDRLQELTLKDAAMEGMDLRGPMFTKFVEFWNSTVQKHPNKFKRYPYCWEDNPWVWVIEFERISKP